MKTLGRRSSLTNSFSLKQKSTYVNRLGLTIALLVLVNLIFTRLGFGQGSQTFSYTGSNQTFTVPAGVTSIVVNVWGAGGAGGGTPANTNRYAGGGAGGAFARGTLAVTPGSTFTITIGAGGAGASNNDGGAGSNTTFGTGTGQIVAIGGPGGLLGTSAGAAGGTAPSSGNMIGSDFTTTASFYGGNGAAGSSTTTSSGGGGGSAGSTGSGGDANGTTGGIAGTGTPAGAAGANGLSSSGTGVNGSVPGSGGSGARNGGSATSRAGGSGGNGQVYITWICPPNAGTLTGTQTICLNGTATFSSTVLGGTWSSGNTGIATINSSSGAITAVSSGGPVTMTYTVASSGCSTRTATRTVTVGSNPSASVTGQSNISCYSGNDGSIQITASGGTGPYSYSVDGGATWVSDFANPYTYNGLVANHPYRIQVKDANGCISK